ncbi:phospholipase [Pseudomonas purpurea]|uniref:phospholipase n=1 Tax=Pseudomonas purpurea TaxID=3136737 RepID=UPI003262D12B
MTNTNYRATRNWMSSSPGINTLTIDQIIWPGAHNSGMDWGLSQPLYDSVISNWVLCQNQDFLWQLRNGARALDLRFVNTRSGFRTFHGHVLGRSLDELVSAVNTFLNENPDEFIILDLHQLEGTGDVNFDYKGFSQQLLSGLEPRLIPWKNQRWTVQQLKANKQRRVIAAASYHPDLDERYFWAGIRHEWAGQAIVNTADISQHIGNVLKRPPAYGPWSLSVTSYTVLKGPTKLTKELNDWFFPGGGLIEYASIINVDFFDESEIVTYCAIATDRVAEHQALRS